MYVPIARPDISADELEAIVRPLRTGMLVQGKEVARFESQFSAYCQSPFAVACSSCSAALHLALSALGVGPDDEVIVPSFTWITTANAALHLGATPVLCDISLETFNITEEIAAKHITDRTKVILPVHLFGNAAPVDRLLQLLKARPSSHPIFMVEDAACALGTSIEGRPVGTFGDIGCFSLHPRKAITTGEGGMLTTGSTMMRQVLMSLRNCGADERQPDQPPYVLGDFSLLGFNYRMTEMQAAMGQAQLLKARSDLEKRQKSADRYRKALADLGWLRLPYAPKSTVHSYQSFVCLFAPEPPSLQNCDDLHQKLLQLMGLLEEMGVQTRAGTLAVHNTSLYRNALGYKPESCPNAYLASKLSLAIPLFGAMTEDEQGQVIDALHKAAKQMKL